MFALTADIFFLLNHSYLHTDVDILGDPALSQTLSDDIDFPSAPKNSVTFGVDWSLAHFSFGTLNLNMDYNYIARRKGLVFKGREGLSELPEFDLFNARLALVDIPVPGGNGSTASVALWGKNLLDEEYMLHAVDNLPQAGRPRRVVG